MEEEKGKTKMRLGNLYDLAVKEGTKADPRGEAAVRRELKKARSAYRKLSAFDRSVFDREALTNPYSDTRILYGDRNVEIESVFVGVDMEVGEILLADRLRQEGRRVDLVMSHHPEGTALAGLYNVMGMQAAMLGKAGLSNEIAKELLDKRIEEVERRILPANHMRSVDAARLLDIPYMCAHTVADNHVSDYLQKLMDKKRPRRVGDVFKILRAIPEYKEAARIGAGPKLITGDMKKPVGKVLVEMTGGTEGSKEVYARLSQAGIGTVIAMHLSEEHFRRVKTEHINVIIAGHIASDSIGLNLLLDKLARRGRLQFIEGSGFKRVERTSGRR